MRAENLKRLATRRCGEAIREHRIKRGYSQAYVAERLGIEESTYSRSERTGVGLDSVFRLYTLSQTLDMDFKALVCAEYQPSDKSDLETEALFDTIFHALMLLRTRR